MFTCKFCGKDLLGFYEAWNNSKQNFDYFVDFDCLNKDCKSNYILKYSKELRNVIQESVEFDGMMVINRFDENSSTIFLEDKEINIDNIINFSSKNDFFEKIKTYVLFA